MQGAMSSLELAMYGQLSKHGDLLPVLATWVTSGPGQLVARSPFRTSLTQHQDARPRPC